MTRKFFSLAALALLPLLPSLALADRWDDQIVLTIDKSGKAKESISLKDAEKGRSTLDDLKAALQEGEKEKLGMVPCYRGQPKEVFEIVRALVDAKDGNKVDKEEIESYLDLLRESDQEYNILTTHFTGKKGKRHAIVLVQCAGKLKAKSGRSSAFNTFGTDDEAGI